MFLSLRTRWWWALAAAACLLAGQLIQPGATMRRQRYHLVARSGVEEGIPPEYILTNALLGGFRSVLVQVLWQRAQNMKQENKYYEMVDIYNITTKLQPGHHMAWAFMAWDLSYNVSVEFTENLEDRIFWVFRGIDMLRFQGIPKNTNIPELPHELAWIFHHKLGATMDFAHPYYRRELAAQVNAAMRVGVGDFNAEAQAALVRVVARLPVGMEDTRAIPAYAEVAARFAEAGLPDPFRLGPDAVNAAPENVHQWLTRAYADPEAAAQLFDGGGGRAAAAAAARPVPTLETIRGLWSDPKVANALRVARYWYIAEGLRRICGMEPERMHAIVREYGPIDWRTPFAHSLYWAHQAHRIWWARADKKPDLKYERLLYTSLISLAEASRMVQGSDGFAYYLPDYRLVDAVSVHMEGMVKRYQTWKQKDYGGASLNGMLSAYTYFLRDAIFAAYFENRQQQAQRLLDRLIMAQWQRQLDAFIQRRQVTPEQVEWLIQSDLSRLAELRRVLPVDDKYNGTLAQVVEENMGEFMDSPNVEKSISMMDSWLTNAYWALSLGDADQYRRQALLAQTYYETYCMVRWPQKLDVASEIDNRFFIPPLDDLRFGVLRKIVTNSSTRVFTDPLKVRLLQQLGEVEPNSMARLRTFLSSAMAGQPPPATAPTGGMTP